MGRFLGFLYGIVAYLVFFASFLYAIGFVSGVGVPKTIDNGPTTPVVDGADRRSHFDVGLCRPAQRDGTPGIQADVDQNRAMGY